GGGVGERPGQADDTVLAGGVGERAVTVFGVTRSDADNSSPLLLHHVGQGGLDDVEGMSEVEEQIVLEVFRVVVERVELSKIVADNPARVVDHDIEPAQLLGGFVNAGGDLLAAHHDHDDRHAASAHRFDLCGDRVQFGSRAGTDGNVGARLRHRERYRTP